MVLLLTSFGYRIGVVYWLLSYLCLGDVKVFGAWVWFLCCVFLVGGAFLVGGVFLYYVVIAFIFCLFWLPGILLGGGSVYIFSICYVVW